MAPYPWLSGIRVGCAALRSVTRKGSALFGFACRSLLQLPARARTWGTVSRYLDSLCGSIRPGLQVCHNPKGQRDSGRIDETWRGGWNIMLSHRRLRYA